MDYRRIYAIFLRQVYLLKGSPSRLFIIFFWATADLLIWGVLTVWLNKIGGDNFNFITVLIGSIVLLHFLAQAHHGTAVSTLEDVWARNFINLFASPLTLKEYVFGLGSVSVLTSLISLTAMAALSWLFFAYNIFQFGFLLLPFMAVLFVFGAALGLLSVTLIIRFGPSAESLVWAIPAAISPLAGVFYPVSVLPGFLQFLARFLPPAYVFEGMRAVVLGGTFDARSLITAFLLSLFWIMLSYGLLKRYYRLAKQKGLFSRFLVEEF